MADVFRSYARSTLREAKAVADGLRSAGYDVWVDAELPTHRSYTDVIEEQLAASKAVVVVWSAEASRSEWVRSEANRAREERRLVRGLRRTSSTPAPRLSRAVGTVAKYPEPQARVMEATRTTSLAVVFERTCSIRSRNPQQNAV